MRHVTHKGKRCPPRGVAYQNDCKHIPDTAEVPLQSDSTLLSKCVYTRVLASRAGLPQDPTNTMAYHKIVAHAVVQLPLHSYWSSVKG